MTAKVEQFSSLSEDINRLGQSLGTVICAQEGEEFFKLVEHIRALSKSSRQNDKDNQRLRDLIRSLPDSQTPKLARAFGQFLNLANIAESYQCVRLLHGCDQDDGVCALEGQMESLLSRLKADGKNNEQIYNTLCAQKIELVLTAHPTEVKRRTLIQKYAYIAGLLEKNDRMCLSSLELRQNQEKLDTLITSIWQTDEIRRVRPTPVEEAKWGFAVIEDSLWYALPQYLRRLDQIMQTHLGKSLPMDCVPIRIAAWMGGDRDGNPNVTAKVTTEVLRLSRWMAFDLYSKEVDLMVQRLSMNRGNEILAQKVGEVKEPYRVYLRQLRQRLKQTRNALMAATNGDKLSSDDGFITTRQDLLEPLMVCYQSLLDCNAPAIANAGLLDLIRRVHCFGLSLVQLDIRQEADRHRHAIAAVTQYLGLGDYATWSEQEKQQFLISELNNPRPLLAQDMPMSDEVHEVFATFKLIANQDPQALGAYIISMASAASDVLAVQLLQKMCDVASPMRVVPLFETLDDLQRASSVMEELFAIETYYQSLAGEQEVMIGYSDSGKDAGKLAASWAQYETQEQLVAVAKKYQVKLTLFHGRGGSVGRGGGPVRTTLLSQPPGSVDGRFRVTEQGEVIQQKYGVQEWARHNLMLYSVAVLEATLMPPEAPKKIWRQLIQHMAEVSVQAYRHLLREVPEFIPYFHQVTPEKDLGRLLIGSRPSKRKAQGGIESLRAIPWVFAWTQIRLMLPAWLGVEEALAAVPKQETPVLHQMLEQWPFFCGLFDMLDMVMAKSDIGIAEYYDQCLAEPSVQALGKQLRETLSATLTRLDSLMSPLAQDERQKMRDSIALRNTYADPINLLQAEVMRRLRQDQAEDKSALEDALMLTIAGISAAMKNTG